MQLAPHGGAADWSFDIAGMASAVEVRKMWTSRPYEEDESDPPKPAPPRLLVFTIRAMASGEATVRFRAAQGDSYEVAVRVEP